MRFASDKTAKSWSSFRVSALRIRKNRNRAWMMAVERTDDEMRLEKIHFFPTSPLRVDEAVQLSLQQFHGKTCYR
jgi:hypothetical protein